jgi:hypothetical protein
MEVAYDRWSHVWCYDNVAGNIVNICLLMLTILVSFLDTAGHNYSLDSQFTFYYYSVLTWWGGWRQPSFAPSINNSTLSTVGLPHYSGPLKAVSLYPNPPDWDPLNIHRLYPSWAKHDRFMPDQFGHWRNVLFPCAAANRMPQTPYITHRKAHVGPHLWSQPHPAQPSFFSEVFMSSFFCWPGIYFTLEGRATDSYQENSFSLTITGSLMKSSESWGQPPLSSRGPNGQALRCEGKIFVFPILTEVHPLLFTDKDSWPVSLKRRSKWDLGVEDRICLTLR